MYKTALFSCFLRPNNQIFKFLGYFGIIIIVFATNFRGCPGDVSRFRLFVATKYKENVT